MPFLRTDSFFPHHEKSERFLLLFFACLLTAYFSPLRMERAGDLYFLFFTLSCQRLFFTVTTKDESEMSAVDTFHS
ncbi:hypothetical protein JCM10003_3888 [Bacteroides pyogenes JCM 10003]|nr:hypothetical protein JCM10003_3888 [Bacteroides pyogenes JCM 10003]